MLLFDISVRRRDENFTDFISMGIIVRNDFIADLRPKYMT